MKLLHRVHAAISFGEQTLYVETILRAKGCADTQRDQIAAGNLISRLDSECIQAASLFNARILAQAGSNNHKFVTTHAGDVVIASAGLVQVGGKILEQVVAFEVAVEVVDLLEIVEVANHDGQCCACATAAGQFARQVHEERASVGQAG